VSEIEHAESDETVEPEAGVEGDVEGNVEGNVEGDVEGEREERESLPASDELAAALKEAEESIDERQAQREAAKSGADASDSADKMTIELLAEELQSLKSEHEKTLTSLAEAEEKPLRLQAEFENFRRRTMKEKQDTFKYGAQNLVKDLLATVDNLERAVAHGEESGDGDFQSLLQGVELVRNELLGILGNHGVKPIEAEEQLFDPAMHEAMAQVLNPDVPVNTVLQVLQPGYMLRDRMLRPARVIVSKAAEETSEQAAVEVEEEQAAAQDGSHETEDDAFRQDGES
jgi:molecular chaperone GrpE